MPLLPSALVLSLRGETPFLRSTLVTTQSIGDFEEQIGKFGREIFMSLLPDLEEIKGKEDLLAS
jgi:hypothetical protein